MKKSIFVHVPFPMLVEELTLIATERVNVEIYFPASVLDELPASKLKRVKQVLTDNGLACTFHAPFMDLAPGAFDSKIGAVTRERFTQLLAVARDFSPKVIVFHPGYDERRYGKVKAEWLAHSIQTWQWLVEQTQQDDFLLALENIFDPTPTLLQEIINRVNSPRLKHCLDIGHFQLFARCSLTEWFQALGGEIVEVHLHDNHGDEDEHLAIGEGIVDFPHLFELLSRQKQQIAWVIEAHSEQGARTSLKRLAEIDT